MSAARCATGRFLEAIGPSAIVSQGFAAEELRIVGLRLIGEHHHDLACHVRALVIVPAELRGGDAMADEHRFGIEILDGGLRLAHAGKLLFKPKGDGLVPFDGRQRRLGPGRDPHQRHRLEERVLLARRFQS